MDNNYVLGPNGELYHWGTKGMKWGIRRYQNKDGSLTPAGRKRYNSESEKLKAREKDIKGREKAAARQAKLDAKKAELDAREAALKSGKAKVAKKTDGEHDAIKPKSLKDMSDDELRALTTRMQLEKNYLDAQKNLASATPKEIAPQKVKRGRDFLNNIMNDVIAPSVKSTAKDWLEKTLKEKAGLNKKEALDPLKKLENEAKKAEQEFKKLEWEKKTKDLKEGKTGEKTDWDGLTKEQTYEKNRKSTQIAKEQYQAWLKERQKAIDDGTYDEWIKKQGGGGN